MEFILLKLKVTYFSCFYVIPVNYAMRMYFKNKIGIYLIHFVCLLGLNLSLKTFYKEIHYTHKAKWLSFL